MNLKRYMEVLRGREIGQLMPYEKIPCHETSDAEKLCRHPLVTVQMSTYNHERYIRQAIESVMMQKTNFEYELVVAEDCSTDRTREICFELQKKYPERIRVLWSETNLFAVGGNSRRARIRHRGEFLAFCEGDDWWIDPYKLQKQVEVFRKNPTVGFCFCRAKRYFEKTGKTNLWEGRAFCPGLIPGHEFFDLHCRDVNGAGFIMTASVMYRRSAFLRVLSKYEIFSWKLSLGDTQDYLAMSNESDAYFLPDIVSVYRINSGSVMGKGFFRVLIDGALVRLYFLKTLWSDKPVQGYLRFIFKVRVKQLFWMSRAELVNGIQCIKSVPDFAPYLHSRKIRLWLAVLSCPIVPMSLVRGFLQLRRAFIR